MRNRCTHRCVISRCANKHGVGGRPVWSPPERAIRINGRPGGSPRDPLPHRSREALDSDNRTAGRELPPPSESSRGTATRSCAGPAPSRCAVRPRREATSRKPATRRFQPTGGSSGRPRAPGWRPRSAQSLRVRSESWQRSLRSESLRAPAQGARLVPSRDSASGVPPAVDKGGGPQSRFLSLPLSSLSLSLDSSPAEMIKWSVAKLL